MFGRKSDSPEVKIENAETAKACGTCGCVVLTAKLKEVETWTSFGIRKSFYCGRCKPPYDKVTYCTKEVLYERLIPEHYIFVTKAGEEIKPKKKVAKNAKK